MIRIFIPLPITSRIAAAHVSLYPSTLFRRNDPNSSTMFLHREGEEEVFPEKNDCAGISCWEKSSFRYESRPWLLDPIDRANVNAKSKEEKQREEKEMFSVREFRKKGGLVLL